MNENRKIITQNLVELLNGGHAHITFEKAIAGIGVKHRDVKPDRLPYSIWQLIEHIRITQWDILEFSRNPAYQSPAWPEGYWSSPDASPKDADWEKSIIRINKDRQEFIQLLQDPDNDLYAPFPHGNGQNLLREALLIADHNAYHIGEILVIRRILGEWKKNE